MQPSDWSSSCDFHFSYFADTLANQEASRHSGPLTVGDMSMAESSTLMATQRPMPSVNRMYSNSSATLHPLPPASNRASCHLGQQYAARNAAAIHCGPYNVS